MNCCNSAKQMTRLQKELKLWKERYFVEKKCRKLIESWSLSAFGFDVRVEYDKNTSTVRIQGIENKEMMKTAAVPNESSDAELRVVVMEVTLENNDFFEDGDDMIALPPIPMEVESSPIINASSTGKIGQILGTNKRPMINMSNIVSNNTVSQQQYHQSTSNALEISSPPGAAGSEVYYIGNYDDGSGTGEKIFIFTKPGENEEVPIQFDYPQFINGDVGSGSEKQVYYRIATPEPPPQSVSPSPVYEIVQSTPPPNPAKKRKLPTSKNTGSKPSKPKKPNTSKVSNKTIIVNAETEDDAPIVIAVTTAPPPIDSPKMKQQDSYQVTKEPEEKSNNSRNQPPLEFGLTLRERAEIYVRTKAKEAIRKVGNGYECILCPDARYFYSCLENAITHTKGHFDGKPYKCEQCEETFGIQRELLQHRKFLHPKHKGPPAKPTSLHSMGQPLHQIPPPGKGAATAVVVTTSTPTSNAKKPVSQVGGKSSIKSSVPPPNNSKNQYKCTVEGCEWSYSSEVQLGWHMKAHSQARV